MGRSAVRVARPLPVTLDQTTEPRSKRNQAPPTLTSGAGAPAPPLRPRPAPESDEIVTA